MKKAFTLIELLVVIGIIAIISGVAIATFSPVIRSSDNKRAQELVLEVANSLMKMYVRDGQWPKRLIVAAEGDNLLDEEAAVPLATKGYFSLDYHDGSLRGYDRFGIITPWATTAIKARGKKASKTDTVGSTSKTFVDHTLRFAIDVDDDGFTELPEIEGYSGGKKVRATACVWCCSKEGSLEYRNLIKSWTDGQVVK